jgi:hypothetical protein
LYYGVWCCGVKQCWEGWFEGWMMISMNFMLVGALSRAQVVQARRKRH